MDARKGYTGYIKMPIQTTIHKMEAYTGTCIVTVIDDGEYVFDHINIGITADGNTAYVEERIKNAIFKSRQSRQNNLNNPKID